MNMNWDYIAGFFDVEGCLSISKLNKIAPGRQYEFSIAQNNTESLDTIKNFLFGQGIQSVIRSRKGHSNLWVYRQPDILKILLELHDKCIVKREKIYEALEDLSNRELRQNNSSYCYFTVHKDEGDKVKALWLNGKGIISISKETGYSTTSLFHFINRILGGAKMREAHRVLQKL